MADFTHSNGQSLAANLQRYSAERDIYGRAGKLFVQEILTDPQTKAQSLGPFQWLANVTEVTASMTIEKMEVRRSSDLVVKYKPGEITGEGTLTMDKVNSYFEKIFIDHVNSVLTGGGATNLPFFHVTVSLEDPGIPGIEYDENGFAKTGHEEVILQCVQFWTMPFGYSTSDLVTRDLDFTFQGISFGGNNGANFIDETKFTDFPTRLC
jgi:hypothetical protein